MILDLLRVLFFALERFTQWRVGRPVPRHKELSRISVPLLLELLDLVLADELELQNSQEFAHVHMPESAIQCCHVGRLSKYIGFTRVANDILDGEVGSDQDGATRELRRLVFLIDGEPGFITECLEEVRRQLIDRIMVQILEKNVVMHLVIVEIKEPIVQVLLVRVWVNEGQHRGLALSRRTV